METFSALGLMFSEILILNSQPQGSFQGSGGFCSEVQLHHPRLLLLTPAQVQVCDSRGAIGKVLDFSGSQSPLQKGISGGNA